VASTYEHVKSWLVDRVVHSIDRWSQMPPAKKLGESKKLKTGGRFLFDGKLPKILKYA